MPARIAGLRSALRSRRSRASMPRLNRTALRRGGRFEFFAKVETVGSTGAKLQPKTASQSRLPYPSQRRCERPAYRSPAEAADAQKERLTVLLAVVRE